MYLADGIYGEITLHYRDRRWQHHDSTFPHYRRADYQAFFSQCREYLRAAEKWIVATGEMSNAEARMPKE